MSDQSSLISKAFQAFASEAPQHAQAWGSMAQGLAAASALDKKTSALAYLAVLAAMRLESGIPFHVKVAKQAGATRVQIAFSRQPSPTVVVNDDGSGVPAAIRDQIWLPFFSTREKGSGMGLPLVRKMILALGGDILVEAPEGPHAKGARFVLTFYPRA